MHNRIFTTCLCFLILTLGLHSQSNSIFTGEMPKVSIKKSSDKITLDGKLDEAIWTQVNAFQNFTQYSPTDSLAAISPTEVYITYDDDYIYIASKCKMLGDQIVVPSLKRDYGFSGSDNITFLFDTFNDKTNSFVFGINPLGVRREATINNGGRDFRNFTFSWDNKWKGRSFIGEDYWTSEIAIPLSTLRFNKGSKIWRFNCYRNDTQANEITSWIQIPDNNNLADITFMGEIHFDEPLENTSSNISVIPYASGSITRDFEDLDQLESDIDGNIGGDAKIAITSGMNLDLTLNPDFSQVEVDRQVTNLDRFEIFFPERRQFFIENADLFSKFGTQRINPFFSRRIGVAVDTTTDDNIQNTIYGGLRLSGKLNDDLRVGLINMQTASDAKNDLASYNYSVLALEHQVFDRSSVAFAFINKQALNYNDYEDSNDEYNRVGALEYRLATSDNVWSGKLSYQQAFTTTEATDKFAQFANLTYNKKRIRLDFTQSYIGNGFDAQVGFVPRKDILSLSPSIRFNFYPTKYNIRQANLSFDLDWIYKLGEEDNEIVSDFKNIEKSLEIEYQIQFKSGPQVEAEANFNEILLLEDFDPTRIQEDDIFLDAGENFRNYLFELQYTSDRRKDFFYTIEPFGGRFYDGLRAGFFANLNFRIQPYANIGLRTVYNHINIDRTGFETANLWLIGPRIELTFSKSLFLTTFIQYNSQIDNLNINTRLQWRFAPVSDFFLVYTDNYMAEEFGQLSSTARGVVAKFTYWINL